MDPIAFTIGFAWTLAGLVCIGLAIPMARGRTRRNLLYGARFRESFESDEAWQAINRFGGKQLIGWSIPLLVVGLVSFFLPLQAQPGLSLTLGFAPLVFVLAPAFNTWRFARRREWAG
jgi:hypothetical protein